MKFNGGFSTDKTEMVPLPATFFTAVLPDITNISELKVTLQIFWLLSRQQTFPRYVARATLQSDRTFMQGLKTVTGPQPAEVYLDEGLALAVARGSLLEIILPTQDGPGEYCYLVNTSRNRRLLADLQAGKLDSAIFQRPPLLWAEEEGSAATVAEETGGGGLRPPQEERRRREGSATRLEPPRPNIYGLYEQNIGLLTPLIAEQLGEAEQTYPAEWIMEAFNEAVSLNKRNWRYIQRILENWAIRGKDDAKDRRYSGGALDPDKYKKGKYAHLFRRK